MTPARTTTPPRWSSLRSETRRAPAWALSIICLGAVALATLFAVAVVDANTELLNGLTIGVLLVGLTMPIAFRIARSDRDPTLVGIVMAAVVAKMLGALLRYYVAFELYGNSDALQYHKEAQLLAPHFRSGNFDPQIGAISGTNFVKVLSGVVYAIFGVSRVSGFFVFAWMGFVGLVLIARAFRLAIPEGDSRRYLILVLFLPSLVYWPSSMGKEAWMMLAIGLSVYGVAGIFRGRTTGVVALGLGLLATGVVRPHVGLIIFLALALALLARRAPARTYAVPLLRFLGLIVLLVVGFVLARETADFLGQPSLTSEVVSNTLSYNEVQTADGGSEFTPVVVNNPLDMGPAFVTVFFRPFPFEASSAQALLSAGEGLILVGLVCLSWKRVRSIPRLIRTRPYVAFCVGYVLVFVYAFSSFSNFGILARQRVQVLPFFLVFLALPEYQTLPRTRRRRDRAPRRVPAPATRRRTRRPPRALVDSAAPPPGRVDSAAPSRSSEHGSAASPPGRVDSAAPSRSSEHGSAASPSGAPTPNGNDRRPGRSS